MSTLIGLDIGGANLKLSNGIDRTVEIPFPMWKDPESLVATLQSLESMLSESPDIIALTMTGELADCFRTKAEGVERILSSVEAAFPQAEIRVWQTGAEFFNVRKPASFRFWSQLRTGTRWRCGRGEPAHRECHC